MIIKNRQRAWESFVDSHYSEGAFTHHRQWELANSEEEAIIYLSDYLFVYLSGEERMEETQNQ